jgi:NADH-quinone oxidoreductase subunit G
MSTELIKVTINGQEIETEKGAKLIEVCNKNGAKIPSFCYYSDLEVQASCRMCLVRIDKMPKLQTSCTISCTDGMVVTTNTEEIEKAQRAMSEFLLANHPLDCPVCDRGGECELQEMVMEAGSVEERFTERKTAHAEKFLSPMVANDQQRCILCKRCTRVCDEWMGETVLEAGNRGANTVIGTYGGWLGCSQCGNCIEVCPTGTLLDGVYRHSTRPWELERTITTDTYSSDGMQLSIGSRGGEVHRIVARDRYVDGLNGEFLDVKARFAHEFINHADRIKTPLIRYKKGGKAIPATWDDAISFVANKLKDAKNVGVVASPRLTNESIFTLKRLAKDVLKTDSYAVSDSSDLSPFFANMSARLCTHKEIRHAKTILLIGGEPEEEQTYTAKQMRQAVRNGKAKLIIVNETPINLTKSATRFVHVNKGSIDAFVWALTDAANDKVAETKLGIESGEINKVRETINATEGDIIIAFGNELSAESQALIAQLPTHHEGQNILLHPLAKYNNSVGANDMTSSRKSLAEVLKTSKTLIIGGSLQDAKSLEGKDFVVVQELFETETTDYADVILPAASFAEQDGTYTNNAGNIQRVRQAIDLVNQAKPDWMIADLIAKESGVDFNYQRSASAVFKALADDVSAYNGLRYPDLKDESNPIQANYKIHGKNDLSNEIKALAERVEAMSDESNKNNETPRVGHKLHRLTVMTSKTPQFHLLANGNPKPENLHISPLKQFDLQGKAVAAG